MPGLGMEDGVSPGGDTAQDARDATLRLYLTRLFLPVEEGVLAADISPENRQWLQAHLGPVTIHPVSKPALLAEIRQQRVAWAHSPLLPGIDAIAAPVFDYRGKLAAVICAVGRTEVMRTKATSPVVKSLDDAARALSRRLGHIEAPPEPQTEALTSKPAL